LLFGIFADSRVFSWLVRRRLGFGRPTERVGLGLLPKLFTVLFGVSFEVPNWRRLFTEFVKSDEKWCKGGDVNNLGRSLDIAEEVT
jgi:hypothetical protein